MPGKEVIRRETKGLRLTLELGTKMLVSFRSQEEPVKAVFVGMEPGGYLILRLPSGAGMSDHLYEGNKAVVKYVSFGNVYGFQSEVSSYLFKRNLVLVIMTYPSAVEVYELRGERRVEVHLPAEVKTPAGTHRGFILDLSPSGCRFAFREDEQPLPDLEAGAEVSVSVRLLGMQGQQNIICRVRNVFQGSIKSELGLSFKKLSDEVLEAIKVYVDEVSDFLELHSL